MPTMHSRSQIIPSTYVEEENFSTKDTVAGLIWYTSVWRQASLSIEKYITDPTPPRLAIESIQLGPTPNMTLSTTN